MTIMNSQNRLTTVEEIARAIEEDLSPGGTASRRKLARAGVRIIRPLLLLVGGSDWPPRDANIRDRRTILIASYALQKIAEESPDHLVLHLKDEDARVRSEACRQIGTLKVSDARSALIDVIDGDADPKVIRQAILSISQLGDMSVEPVLLHELDSPDESRREAAILALGEIRSDHLRSRLPELILSDSQIVGSAAVTAAGLTGARESVPVLIDLLKSGRYLGPTIVALGKLRATEAVEVLSTFVDSPMRSARDLLARSLGLIEDPIVMESLLLLADDVDGRVRRTACESIGKIGDHRGKAPLMELLKSDEESDRDAARAALAELRKRKRLDREMARSVGGIKHEF